MVSISRPKGHKATVPVQRPPMFVSKHDFAVPMQTITLMHAHTHLDTQWATGAVLAVHPQTAQWLVAIGVAILGSAQAEFSQPTPKD